MRLLFKIVNKNNNLRSFRVIALLTLNAVALPTRAASVDAAGDYPQRPIRFILANGPGSNADIFTRILAHKLGENLGQQVVVDSRPGAGGMLGIDIAAKSAPDGYTMARGNLPALAIAPQSTKKCPMTLCRICCPYR